MQDKMVQYKLNFEGDVNKNKYYLYMSNILINNPLFKAKLFEYFDYDIERTFRADKSDLLNFSEAYPQITIPKKFIEERNKIDSDKILNEAAKNNIKFITFEDELYPPLLKEIEDFPLLLYYKGSFSDINFERTVAVVGSRKASESAKLNLKSLIDGFKHTDVVIVSGLASGIDSVSHISALENNLKTVAVIGSGLKFVYPSTNSKLYREIEENGLILSEYPYSTPPMAQNFPQRNRIVTGLSKGTLVAEAAIKSGAMISARCTLEQNRELMCMPGLINNPNCEGIYQLIRQGASVVSKTEDILNTLLWDVKTNQKKEEKLSGLTKQIYDIISMEEISTELLKQKLDVGINDLVTELTRMELSGLIVQKNGLYYTLGK